ncbi:hypothetical protein OAO01_05075 [Oligoflexia bacterium]|nr:hypothetical protein [Oligoflexia bacterium]
MSKTEIELNSPESWQKAKALAETVGYIPIAFTSTVRLLIIDHFGNDATIRPVTKYQVARLLRSDSFKAMLYYSSVFIHHDKLGSKKQFSVGHLIDFYRPIDLAALIGLYVLFRKCRKICNKGYWPRLVEEMTEESRISAAIGNAIPAIGTGIGFIVGTIRHLALTAFINQESMEYKAYRRTMVKKGSTFDDAIETEKWGCTSLQVSSILLSALGFGVKVADSYMVGMNPKLKVGDVAEDVLAYRVEMAKLWFDAVLLEGKHQPDTNIPGDYYPLQTAQEALQHTIKNTDPELVHWMERGPGDLGAVQTPELFQDQQPEETEFEVPDELSEVFSLDELTGMEEEDFDVLLDQIETDKAATGKDEATTFLEDGESVSDKSSKKS